MADFAEDDPVGGEAALPSAWLVISPLTCAKPVMERRGIIDFSSFPLQILAGLRRLQFLLEMRELQLIQTPVRTQPAHQIFVSANVGDGAIFYHHNAVGTAHSREPVRNHEHS